MATITFNIAESEAIRRYETTEEIDAFRDGALWSAREQLKSDIEKMSQVYSDLLSAQGYDVGTISTELYRLTKRLNAE